MKKSAIGLLILCGAVLLCSCTSSEMLSPNMVKVGGKNVDLYEDFLDLKEQLGDKIDSSSKNQIIQGDYPTDFGDYWYSEFMPVFGQDNPNRKKLVLYNGISSATSAEKIDDILGDSCIKIVGEQETDYIEMFVNGVEIDYSQIDLSTAEDEKSEYVRYSKAGRNYCEMLLEDSTEGSYIVIRYMCYPGRDNDIGVSVLKKKQ